MSESDFDFSIQKNKKILDQKPQQVGRPKIKKPKKNKVTCYFTDEEFRAIKEYLNGRPASSTLTYMILEKIAKKEGDLY